MKAQYYGAMFLSCIMCTLPVRAHVGTKDVFEQTNAGPYRLFITIRPPSVIPGVAGVEVRAAGGLVSSISITSTPMTGEAARHPPTADNLRPSVSDPMFFTGAVWLMEMGSWTVNFEVHGSSGSYVVRVPVPVVELSSVKMSRELILLLIVLISCLMCGAVNIIVAAARQATLPSGIRSFGRGRIRGWSAGSVTMVVLALIAAVVVKSWTMQASQFSRTIYRPPVMYPVLDGHSLHLLLDQSNSHYLSRRYFRDDFILDHGKMMHLYVIRMPQMDAVFHLHPRYNDEKKEFDLIPPTMPQGKYMLYGDVVHSDGFPETLLATLYVPEGLAKSALQSDDAEGFPSPLKRGLLGRKYLLPDRYTMVWDAPGSLLSGTSYVLHFRLLDPAGRNADDMQPYLGMAGHAAIVKTDGSVFAHVHPEGSAAMAAMMLANSTQSMSMANTEEMPGMDMNNDDDQMSGVPWDTTANSVDFPFGFPSSGQYRVFVQMKHGHTVETGAFDVIVH